MQAIGRQPQQAPDGASVHYERHRPEQTTRYRLVQQHAATFIGQAEAEAGAERPGIPSDNRATAGSPTPRNGGSDSLEVA